MGTATETGCCPQHGGEGWALSSAPAAAVVTAGKSLGEPGDCVPVSVLTKF